ncbi:MAG: iron-containing alcohol dehydrogenase [Eubacteriales bacterium]|nr:iron-containing alcohol dehydrogenase [Eubacteriales bacterium]
MIPDYYEFQNSVKILSGKNALENIPFELYNLQASRPIVLTNEMLEKIGLVQTVIKSFAEQEISVGAIYTDIPADSSIEVVNDAARVFREQECDSIIAIGGGSVIDTAKGLSIVITQGSDDIMEYMGSEIITRKNPLPFIVVPTTAGTGSETTLVAVIANLKRKVKMEFLSYNLLPDVAVLDPRMTTTLPPRLTASTGIDALSHAVEGYTCLQKNPLSDAYAFAAINLIREYLDLAVEKGTDAKARLAMANASMLAGVAFSNSMVGLVHAIGHACGGVSQVPHGDAMGILLPWCMEYNMDKLGELYAQLLLPLAGADIYAATPAEKRGQKAADTIREMTSRFNKICGLPVSLQQAGVKKEDLGRIAKTALNDGAVIINPKESEYEDILAILNKAY